jgi:hypothetical protein
MHIRTEENILKCSFISSLLGQLIHVLASASEREGEIIVDELEMLICNIQELKNVTHIY